MPVDLSHVNVELSASISKGANQSVRFLKVQTDDMSLFV